MQVVENSGSLVNSLEISVVEVLSSFSLVGCIIFIIVGSLVVRRCERKKVKG